MVKITFNLDKTYKSGTNLQTVKELKAQGKSISKFLNPKVTPIYLWISCEDFEHFKMHSGILILASHWDFEKKEAKSSCPNHIEINLLLSGLKNGIQAEILKRQINGDVLHYEDIKQITKDQIVGIKPVVRTTNFLVLIDEFLEDKKYSLKPLTQKKYISFRNVLETFSKTLNYELTLSRIDYDFEKDFNSYMIEKKRAVNTISKYFECVKSVMRWSKKKGYHRDNRFIDFKAPRHQPDKTALSLQELKVLVHLEIDYEKEENIGRVRDMFCVQLLSGQRFSDVLNMQWNHFKTKGVSVVWKLFQTKGNKTYPVYIPLHPWIIKILERYKIKDYHELIFPYISNVRMNQLLKVLCERAGFNDEFSTIHFSGKNRYDVNGKKWAFVTTHTARRSFVTIAMQLGMDPQAIMRITGHTKYDIMQQYMKMDESYQIEHFHNTWGKLDLDTNTKNDDQAL